MSETPKTTQAEHDSYQALMSAVHQSSDVMRWIGRDLEDLAGAFWRTGNDKVATQLEKMGQSLREQAPITEKALNAHIGAALIETQAQTNRLFVGILNSAISPKKAKE